MRIAVLFAFMLMAAGNAFAHGYRAGPIEITHPAIMVPSEKGAYS